MVSGIIDVIRDGLQRKGAPKGYGPQKWLYNCFVGWCAMGMFGRLKDWRRIAMRHFLCAHTFFSEICLVSAVIVWL